MKFLSCLPDWTAEDYALMEGHQDIAAELKSPSERMVMSFNDKSGEPRRHDIGKETAKRSVSDASLPPDQQEHEKEVKAWCGYVHIMKQMTNGLTPWYRTILRKLIVIQMFKK
jgi:hypothetical protein